MEEGDEAVTVSQACAKSTRASLEETPTEAELDETPPTFVPCQPRPAHDRKSLLHVLGQKLSSSGDSISEGESSDESTFVHHERAQGNGPNYPQGAALTGGE